MSKQVYLRVKTVYGKAGTIVEYHPNLENQIRAGNAVLLDDVPALPEHEVAGDDHGSVEGQEEVATRRLGWLGAVRREDEVDSHEDDEKGEEGVLEGSDMVSEGAPSEDPED